MVDWPKYQCHKVVQAARIVDMDVATGEFTVDAGTGTEPFSPSVLGMALRARPGDYAIVYADGFRSISPKKEFEDGYRRLPSGGAGPQ